MAFPDDWSASIALTVDSTQVTGSHTDFPALLTRASFGSAGDAVFFGTGAAQSDGGDIRFTSDEAGTTLLNCEIVSFGLDSADGAADASVEIWVKLPSISSAADTTIYCWYGASATETQPAAGTTGGSHGVWTEYALVYHCSDDSGQLTDSTANARHATAVGTALYGQTGMGIGESIDLDGSASYFTLAHADCPDLSAGSHTIQFWCDIEETQNNWVAFFAKSETGANDWAIQFYGSTNNVDIRKYQGETEPLYAEYLGEGSAIRGGGNIKTDWTYDGTNAALYISGVSQGSSALPAPTHTAGRDLFIGASLNGNNVIDGQMDEIRIALEARSGDWLATESANQGSPDAFWSNSGAIVPETLVANGGYHSGNTEPVNHNGKTYFSYSDAVGKIYITQTDNTTGVTTSFMLKDTGYGSEDDHFSGSIQILPGGKILVGYGDKNQQKAWCRLSTSPEDISAWGTEVEIYGVASFDISLFYLSSVSAVYAFIKREWQINDGEYVLYKSTDSGATWSSVGTITATGTSHPYIGFGSNGTDRVDLLITVGDGLFALRHMYFDADTETFHQQDGTSLGSLPITTTSIPAVVTDPTDNPAQRSIDTNGGNPRGTYQLIYGADNEVYFFEWNGTSWDTSLVGKTGDTLGGPGSATYDGRGFLSRTEATHTVYWCRNFGGSGTADVMKSTSADGVTWTSESLYATTGGTELLLPLPVAGEGQSSRAQVFWREGAYTGWGDWTTSIRYLAGVDQFTGTAAGTFAALTGEAEGAFSAADVTGSGAGILAALTGSGAGTITAPETSVTGSGAGTLAALTAAAAGTVTGTRATTTPPRRTLYVRA